MPLLTPDHLPRGGLGGRQRVNEHPGGCALAPSLLWALTAFGVGGGEVPGGGRHLQPPVLILALLQHAAAEHHQHLLQLLRWGRGVLSGAGIALPLMERPGQDRQAPS